MHTDSKGGGGGGGGAGWPQDREMVVLGGTNAGIVPTVKKCDKLLKSAVSPLSPPPLMRYVIITQLRLCLMIVDLITAAAVARLDCGWVADS